MLAAAAVGLLAATCLIRFGLVALIAYFLTGSVFPFSASRSRGTPAPARSSSRRSSR
jgi:hypothetical protein